MRHEGAGRYGARVSGVMPGGCTNSTGFVIEEGPGSEAAYSTLLAATLAGKQVQVYLTRCAYWASCGSSLDDSITGILRLK